MVLYKILNSIHSNQADVYYTVYYLLFGLYRNIPNMKLSYKYIGISYILGF